MSSSEDSGEGEGKEGILSGFLCPFCSEAFKIPKILPNCGHSVCQDCLEKFPSSRKSIICPECKCASFLGRTKPSELKTNETLLKIIEAFKGSGFLSDKKGSGFDVDALLSKLQNAKDELEKCNAELIVAKSAVMCEDEDGGEKPKEEHRNHVQRLSDYYDQKVRQLEQELKERDLASAKQFEVFGCQLEKIMTCQNETFRQVSDHLTVLNEKLLSFQTQFAHLPLENVGQGRDFPKIDEILNLFNTAKNGLDELFQRYVAKFDRECNQLRREKGEMQLELGKKNALAKKLLYRLRTTTMESLVLLDQLNDERKKVAEREALIEQLQSEAEGNVKRMKRVLSVSKKK